ncbi:MAG: alpha/beta hydrolase, partial [Flammeovirgaceae bacterium]
MNRKLIYFSFPIFFIVTIYLLGPTPIKPNWELAMPVVPRAPQALEEYVRRQELKHQIKPDNEARIIWHDSTKQKTDYSLVYIHGFSASQEEGDPVHINFAKKFRCNLY